MDYEKTLRDTLEYNLRREGYGVFVAADGNEAINKAYTERPDLLILDIMLPGMNGFEVCLAIRKELTTPILMLSAREEEIDKVLGLELGADDYLTKPFGLRELLARVGAMLRRSDMLRSDRHRPGEANIETAGSNLVAGGLIVNLEQRTVSQLPHYDSHPRVRLASQHLEQYRLSAPGYGHSGVAKMRGWCGYCSPGYLLLSLRWHEYR